MRLKLSLLHLSFFFILTYQGISQDAHYTNNRYASNAFNPAFSGKFLGNFKFQLATRTQYQSVFLQGLAGAEMNIKSPIHKRHWIGAGVNFGVDQSGSLALTTTGGGVRIGYHMPMDKKNKTIISIGGGLDLLNVGANTKKYVSETTLLNLPDPDQKTLDKFNANVISANVGIGLSIKPSKKDEVNLGVAVMHLNNPSFTIIDNTKEPSFGSRFNLSGTYTKVVNKQFNIEPAIFYSFSERQSNLNLQMMSSWQLNKSYEWRAVSGIAMRAGESIDLILGYQSNKFYTTVSFDIVTNSLASHISNPGGIELGAFYIFNKDAKPKIEPVLFCPRL
jgi:type IX secretion system PorP/SprF family membrane protein